ncbi:MAG: tyrosine-type recombinase/integrase [Nanoarchaeota archaeon]|nr:tyrosine-type recombinase/integrase [Nanoarchaeota archaeon]
MEQELVPLQKDDEINKVEKKLDYEIDLRGFSKQSKESYIYQIKKFLEFVKKHPRLITLTDARKYVLYLKKDKKKPATINLAINSIKFLYKDIWKRKSFSDLKLLKTEKHVPVVISRQDIERMINVTPNTKHKLLIELLYSSGLRIGEAVRIKLNDLRIEEMILLIRLGKGAKDRYVILSERFVKRFNGYMNERKINGIDSEHLFENKTGHITIRTGQEIIKKAAIKAGINYRVFPHALRATFATHLFEAGEQEINIQRLMGHSDLKTTRVYIKSTLNHLRKIKSPIDY